MKYVNTLSKNRSGIIDIISMRDAGDLKRILSDNIKSARKRIGLTQQKLSILTDLSIPYITDIERCRTWVSDKTLQKLGKALRMQPYQLLLPEADVEEPEISGKDIKEESIGFISNEINIQKKAIKKFVEDRMNDLFVQIIKK
jgi:transcriptional regulator with XRE-family HTH domain